MARSGWIAVMVVAVSCLRPLVAGSESDPNSKIADLFEVRLDSAKYATSTQISFSSEGRSERAIERLRLTCEVDIADANLVLGISRRGVVTKLTNGKGEIVEDLGQRSLRPSSGLYSYQGLRYRSQFVPPQKPARWKTAIRSILRLPPPKSSRPQRLDKLAPSRMMLELDAGLFGPDSEKISRVEGHLYVLMAESFEHVDIPFKPTEEWVRVAPGFEIKVLEAQSTQSRYKYRIDARREQGALRGSISPASDLPERFPVNRQLIGSDGKPTRQRIGPLPLSLSGVGGGSGSGGGSNVGIIDKIRFVIAVNPSHHKIPFVLEDIPLPDPDEASGAEPLRAGPRTRGTAQAVPYTPTGPLGGTIHRQTWMNLSWERSPNADSYDVYLGESFDDVNDGVNGTFQGNQNATSLIAGFRGFSYPDGLVPGETYYWRVDEVDTKGKSVRKGKVRSFSIAPRTAFEPFPADGAKSVDRNVALRWTEGLRAKLHRVYFGDDLDAVTNATGGVPQATKTFTPGVLSPGVTYYWRVDEFDPPTTYKGKVWSFTVANAAGQQKTSD